MKKKSYPVVSVESVAKAGLIAALYAVLVYLLPFISYQQYQVRIAEALTALAYLDPAAIIGLYAGAFLANLRSPFGLIDIIFGSLLTLAAAILTYLIGVYFKKHTKKETYRFIGPLVGLIPPVVINAFGVAYILKIAAELPYWPTVISVGIGQFVAVYILGYPLLQAVFKSGLFAHKEKA